MGDFPDMAIGSTSEKFFGLVEFKNMRLNVFGHEKKKEDFKIEIKRKNDFEFLYFTVFRNFERQIDYEFI